jgi:hypothetical protein
MDTWIEHMRRGNFAAAWELSDAILRRRNGAPCWHLPRHEQFVWNGASLAGKRVLVRCYHGLGDTVQFIRYASLLAGIAAEVIVWVQPALLPLVRTVPGVHRVLPLHDGAPDAEFDADVEIMELPHIFRTVLATVPAAVPYLHVEPAALPAHPATGKRPPGLAVGLVWQAGDWDSRRSLPVRLAARLAQVPGVSIYVLQRGEALADWPRGAGVLAGCDDITMAGRIMRALDLVISIDSLPAHLAGALGVPVWTLLPAEADWRWLEAREDSPWYPTMRLFRQAADRPDNWEPVIERVEAALAEATSLKIAQRFSAG